MELAATEMARQDDGSSVKCSSVNPWQGLNVCQGVELVAEILEPFLPHFWWTCFVWASWLIFSCTVAWRSGINVASSSGVSRVDPLGSPILESSRESGSAAALGSVTKAELASAVAMVFEAQVSATEAAGNGVWAPELDGKDIVAVAAAAKREISFRGH